MRTDRVHEPVANGNDKGQSRSGMTVIRRSVPWVAALTAAVAGAALLVGRAIDDAVRRIAR